LAPAEIPQDQNQSTIGDPIVTTLEKLKFKANIGDPGAQYALGQLYDEGEVVSRDYDKALKWYRKAAAQGSAAAQYRIGIFQSRGLAGLSQNATLAFQSQQQAAQEGVADAQFMLGLYYCSGRGVEKDDAQAADWWHKAAQQGHVEAQNNLAFLYLLGSGREQDFSKAAHWYSRAAEQGSAKAQWFLGCLSLQGRGVPQDSVQSYKWLSIATTGKRKPGLADREVVLQLMNPAQVNQGLGLVEELLETTDIVTEPEPELDPND
jgi:TPR repeat protein